MANNVLNLLRLANYLRSVSQQLNVGHVLGGVEGFADFVFPFIANRLMPLPKCKIKDGDVIANLVFKALRSRAIRLASDHLRVLFENREQLLKNNDFASVTERLASIDDDILRLQSMIDNYDEYFGKDDSQRLQRCLSNLLRRRLQEYDRQRILEEQQLEPLDKKQRMND